MRRALLVFGCAIFGCAPRLKHLGDPSPIIKSISFEGNGGALQGTSDFNLRAAMSQSPSPTGWWAAPNRRASRLDPEGLRTDAWRIETWYAHHGYFNARFLGWELITHRQSGRVPLVRLVGHVEQGPETLVRELSWRIEGKEDDDEAFTRVVGAPIAGLLRRQAALQVGSRFSLDDHDDTKALTLSRLRDQSFARATLRARVEVCLDGVGVPEKMQSDAEKMAAAGMGEAPPFCAGREDGAYVLYLANPGPPCRFGDVTLADETHIPEEMVRGEIGIEAGEKFSTSALAQTQGDLFALGTFSVVNVVPELEHPELPPNVVPVRIELQKSRWRQLRLGAGVEIADGTQDLHVSSNFKHVNLFNRLWNFEVDSRVGYTWLGRWTELVTTEETTPAAATLSGGPTAELAVGLDIPRFPGPTWRLEYDASVELGVEPTNQFVEPTGGVTLAWRPSKRWTLGFGVNGQFHDYFNLTVELADLAKEAETLIEALDMRDPYLLAWLSQTLLYDSRDDLLFPTRGAYGSLSLEEAGPPGQFAYQRTEVEGRVYRPLGKILNKWTGWYPHLYWASRLGGGLLTPYALFGEDKATVPYDERLTLGGSSSVRGWVIDHLGPYLCSDGSCSSDPEVAVCDQAKGCEVEVVPIGGLVSSYASTELRGYWQDTYGVVGFVDLGMVWNSLDEVGSPAPLPSLGVGIRYKTPVGPLRLDLARRMGDPAMFRHEPRYQAYFSLSEAF